MGNYYAFFTTGKSYSYHSFQTKEEMMSFLGINDIGEKIEQYTIFETSRIILNEIGEKIIISEHGKLTKDKIRQLNLILSQFLGDNIYITNLTNRVTKMSSEFNIEVNNRTS